jgi:pimeloyl-ACP methyl ester carboxylesterase
MAETKTFENALGQKLVYRLTPGHGPCLVWLCGFRSDMGGTKAAYLDSWAQARNQAMLRFDYRGHGGSEGDFASLGVSDWADDVLAMIDQVAPEGPLVLVGSSMGAWLALIAALARLDRVKALLLIAPAPDFTHRLLLPSLPPEAHRALSSSGRWERPSAYGDGPYIISQTLIDQGAQHFLLSGPIMFSGPVTIMHGQKDPDVPWRLSLELMDSLSGQDVCAMLIKDGDHRLSTPQDLALLGESVEGLLRRLHPPGG